MESEKEMLLKMKEDLDILKNKLNDSNNQKNYLKKKNKIIRKIITPFIASDLISIALFIIYLGIPFKKHSDKLYLNKVTTTYDNDKYVYSYYGEKNKSKPLLYEYGDFIKKEDYYERKVNIYDASNNKLISSGIEKCLNKPIKTYKYKIVNYDYDENEYQIVLESNEETTVRNIAFIITVLFSSFGGFLINDPKKIKSYLLLLNDLKNSYSYEEIEKIFLNRVQNYELLSGEVYER